MEYAVKKFLMEHYGLTEEKATEAINTEVGKKQIKDANYFRSKPYYPADKIADSLGLNHPEPCPACGKEDEETANKGWE